MRVGPTLATGKQGWDKLIGRAVAGFPSHRPGKQDEKAAKPPTEKVEKERTGKIYQWFSTQHTGISVKNSHELINSAEKKNPEKKNHISPPLAEQTDSLLTFRGESGLQCLGPA